MNKKMIAFFTALTCMSALAALPASAEFQVLPDGTWVDATTYPYSGIMVETDGTELTSEMLSNIEGFHSLKTHEEFTKHYCYGNYVTNIMPESTAYMLSIKDMTPEALTKLGRELMVKMDCIKDVHLVDATFYKYPKSLNFIQISTTKTDIVINEEVFPELAGCTFSGQEGIYTVTFPFEEHREMLETQTQYEVYSYYQEIAKNLQNTYSDVIQKASAVCAVEETSYKASNCSASSVWTSAGDSNSDGAVDASDAANVLTIAAQNGTGAAIKATAADDVNADGAVNATDAAAVLCYAAAKGTGADVSWVDILRR